MSRGELLVVVPHASGHVPQDVLGAMLGAERLDLAARERLLRRVFDQGDPYTDLLFDLPGARVVHAAASRFVVDPNRERDARGPNGVVKATDFDAAPLYPKGAEPDEREIEERLRRFWDPFHAEIDRVLREHRIALLLDGHSMTPTGPAIGPDGGAPRPALTLMTAGDGEGERAGEGEPTVAPALARALRDAAERLFAPVLEAAADEVPPRVALNDPWSVDEISRLHGPAAGVPAFGLEINRALYLEPGEDGERPREERIRALQGCVAAFAAEALRLVADSPTGGSR